MYCATCGASASGNFCSVCGAALIPPVAIPQAVPPVPPSWDDEVRYEVVLAVPEVRNRIATNAAAAKTAMTGEQFLELCDKAFKPLLRGVSVAAVAGVAAPVYARLGVRTGKARAQTFHRPVGRVLADVLCFLAASGHGVKRVQQGEDGCVLECALPSDWRSFAGELAVTVERSAVGANVQAATKISGQLYDWGKSRQVLDRLFRDLARA